MRRWMWMLALGLGGCAVEDAAKSEPFACASDQECLGGYICRENLCQRGTRARCDGDDDCRADEVCAADAGRCTPPPPGRCNPAADPGTHCGPTETCAAGTCWPPCQSAEDCGPEMLCHQSVCTPPTPCAEAADCAPGFSCDPAQGACRPVCAADGACGAGAICEAELCRPGCRVDSACGPGQICADTQCTPGCRRDPDCPDGEHCVANACVAGCVVDAHCPGGQFCVDNACTSECRLDQHCPRGEACRDGVCEPRACDEECCDDDGAILAGAPCLPPAPIDYTCQSACGAAYIKSIPQGACDAQGRCVESDARIEEPNNSCEFGQVCLPGQPYAQHCVESDAAPACEPAFDCGLDWDVCPDPLSEARCIDMVCRPYACTSTACNDHGFAYHIGAELPPDERFSRDADVITDHQTGLAWLTQLGPEQPLASAHEWCDSRVSGNGDSDWRLPTWHEALTVGGYDPAVTTALAQFGMVPDSRHWTRTITRTGQAMTFDPSNGETESLRQVQAAHVICVRLADPAPRMTSAAERWRVFSNPTPTDPWTGFHWTTNATRFTAADVVEDTCVFGTLRLPSVVEAATFISWHGQEGDSIPQTGIGIVEDGLWTRDLTPDGRRWVVRPGTGAITAHGAGDPAAFPKRCFQ